MSDVLSTAPIPDSVVADVAREQIAIELGFTCYAEMQAVLDFPRPGEDGPPVWLRRRLERERSKALRDLGFASIDAARAFMAEARELRARLDAANEALTYALAEALSPLTPQQQELVCNVGENDPLSTLRTIHALLPFWKDNT